MLFAKCPCLNVSNALEKKHVAQAEEISFLLENRE
jgi:hypothetical protein